MPLLHVVIFDPPNPNKKRLVSVCSSRTMAERAIESVIRADVSFHAYKADRYEQNKDYYDIIETELDDISYD